MVYRRSKARKETRNRETFPILQIESITNNLIDWATINEDSQDDTELRLCSRQIDLVNLYVALKSKPLLLVPTITAQKEVHLLDYLAKVLTGGDVLQYQTSVGHPWWANGNPDVEYFVDIQHRLITERLLDMIEEAWRPQNAQKIYIAYLTQISPSELQEFFKEVAFQLQHGQIMQIGGVHFSEPIPFPPNLFIVGSVNRDHFDDWETNLCQKATIVHLLPETKELALSVQQRAYTGFEGVVFLESSIRNEAEACSKLYSILGHRKNSQHQKPLLPIFRVKNLISQYGFVLPSDWFEGVVIYLANSWTRNGEGLFAHSIWQNLYFAMDYAIAQSLLPFAKDGLQTMDDFRIQLKQILKSRFPYSSAYIDWLVGAANSNAYIV